MSVPEDSMSPEHALPPQDSTPVEFVVYQGRHFELDEDDWVHFDDGDRYRIGLAHVCLDCDIHVARFEKSRDEAMAAACLELYLLVVSHQARCPNCQSDIVDDLLVGDLLPPKLSEDASEGGQT